MDLTQTRTIQFAIGFIFFITSWSIHGPFALSCRAYQSIDYFMSAAVMLLFTVYCAVCSRKVTNMSRAARIKSTTTRQFQIFIVDIEEAAAENASRAVQCTVYKERT